MMGLPQRRSKLIGYISVAVASAGYYGSYLRSHELLPMWVGIAILGIFLLAAINNQIFKHYHSKLVYLDMLYVAFAFCFPRIEFPRGLSILIMMIGCCAYAGIISNHNVG